AQGPVRAASGRLAARPYLTRGPRPAVQVLFLCNTTAIAGQATTTPNHTKGVRVSLVRVPCLSPVLTLSSVPLASQLQPTGPPHSLRSAIRLYDVGQRAPLRPSRCPSVLGRHPSCTPPTWLSAATIASSTPEAESSRPQLHYEPPPALRAAPQLLAPRLGRPSAQGRPVCSPADLISFVELKPRPKKEHRGTACVASAELTIDERHCVQTTTPSRGFSALPFGGLSRTIPRSVSDRTGVGRRLAGHIVGLERFFCAFSRYDLDKPLRRASRLTASIIRPSSVASQVRPQQRNKLPGSVHRPSLIEDTPQVATRTQLKGEPYRPDGYFAALPASTQPMR
ncbi:hypothetical protein TPAR_03372, partial [Tolypocladium paradoxum]